MAEKRLFVEYLGFIRDFIDNRHFCLCSLDHKAKPKGCKSQNEG